MRDLEKNESILEEMRNFFYDNIKVKWSEQLAANFVHWGRREGFSEENILKHFSMALMQRHADATDMGLNRGNPGMKFELTSTVSMAKERLLEQKDKLKVTTNKETKIMNIREEDKTQSGIRRNPEIDSKLDAFMATNTKMVEFYNSLSKDDLVRKMCLQKMNKHEYIAQQRDMTEKYLDENPGEKAKLEEKAQEDAKRFMYSRARYQMKQNQMSM